VGKSTLAERYVSEHPGVLNCDIDRLRCLVGGWAEDFATVGGIIRPVARAMLLAHLDGGHDVVLPQLLADEGERARIRDAVARAGHGYVHVLLEASSGAARSRFYGRSDADPLHRVVRAVVDRAGGGPAIDAIEQRLAGSADLAGEVVRIEVSGDVDAAYRALVAAVDE
jgi:hypothetical protein